MIREKAEKLRANMWLEIMPKKTAREYAVREKAEEKLRASICLEIISKKNLKKIPVFKIKPGLHTKFLKIVKTKWQKFSSVLP